MTRPNVSERLAQLLKLPASVVHSYAKPRRLVFVTAKRARRLLKAEKISDVRPPARYATLNADAEVLPQEIAPAKTDENELYAQWRDAPDEGKPELEKKLFSRLLGHSKAVIWQMMHEHDLELEALARDIASDAIKNLSLGRFKKGSKFSTYVQGIAKNKIYEEMERRVIRRNRFYAFDENQEDDINLKDSKVEVAFSRVEEGLDLEPLERLVKMLSKKECVLLDCMLDGMTMAKAAEKLGDSEDAAESRWRRLKIRLKKEISGKPDGK
jgi:DNA-directed RNA polymerase specialized sigma24 family protein